MEGVSVDLRVRVMDGVFDEGSSGGYGRLNIFSWRAKFSSRSVWQGRFVPGFAGDCGVAEPPVAFVGALGAHAERCADLGPCRPCGDCPGDCRVSLGCECVEVGGERRDDVEGLSAAALCYQLPLTA